MLPTEEKKMFCFPLLGVGIIFPVGSVRFPPDLFSNFSEFTRALLL